jgi:hypothetical protein
LRRICTGPNSRLQCFAVAEQSQPVFLYGRKCLSAGDDAHRRARSGELDCDCAADGTAPKIQYFGEAGWLAGFVPSLSIIFISDLRRFEL